MKYRRLNFTFLYLLFALLKSKQETNAKCFISDKNIRNLEIFTFYLFCTKKIKQEMINYNESWA